MTILITGANGTISSALLALLASSSEARLRALVRDPAKAPSLAGVEVAIGDLERPDTLTGAFSGVDTPWLLTAAGPQAPHASYNAVWAARNARVSHIVRLSAIGTAHDAPNRNGRLHALSDAELAASGIAYTIVRPSAFMQNMLGSVSGGTLWHNWGQGRVGLIDARDIAQFAAHLLSRPAGHAGKTYNLTGPASLSMTDVAVALTQALGTPITAREIPADAAVAAMTASGMPEWVAEVVGREYSAAYASGWGDYTTADFTAVTGRPARTIADFARDHAAYLTAPGTTPGNQAGPL
jgi:uncharacterized protein YbjT (DUF2867 family)